MGQWHKMILQTIMYVEMYGDFHICDELHMHGGPATVWLLPVDGFV